jgi:predicted enzyme related to lactoylglutathione lyase
LVRTVNWHCQFGTGKSEKDNSPICNIKSDTTVIKQDMKTLISIVEIPTSNFSRALAFYQEILGITIEEIEMEGVRMGLFPNDGESVSVQLINGSEYKPSGDGTIVYLNGGKDLQKVADKIETNGGKIVVPKTEIGPEMGFYAMFTDTEGNKLGLHSYN